MLSSMLWFIFFSILFLRWSVLIPIVSSMSRLVWCISILSELTVFSNYSTILPSILRSMSPTYLPISYFKTPISLFIELKLREVLLSLLAIFINSDLCLRSMRNISLIIYLTPWTRGRGILFHVSGVSSDKSYSSYPKGELGFVFVGVGDLPYLSALRFGCFIVLLCITAGLPGWLERFYEMLSAS